MAFKMAGFSAFTKNGDLPPQDPGSGRSKLAELRHDMQSMKKEITRFEKLAKDNPERYNKPLSNLKNAYDNQQKDYLKLVTKSGMLPNP